MLFELEKRTNKYSPDGVEWSLSVKVNEASRRDRWSIQTWDNEPDEATVEAIMSASVRVVLWYRTTLSIVSKVTEDKPKLIKYSSV